MVAMGPEKMKERLEHSPSTTGLATREFENGSGLNTRGFNPDFRFKGMETQQRLQIIT